MPSGFEVREYVTAEGRCPFREWTRRLPTAIRARIAARVARFEAGNLGDSKALGAGLWEARLMFGPGYRLYFGIEEGRLLILLVGGDKGTQSRDIAKARGYWRDFVEADDEA